MYVNEDSSGSFCTWAGTLMGRKPCYIATKECLNLKALTDKGGFVAKYGVTNEYVCLPDYILLVTETTAECILEKDCDRKQGVTNGYICHGNVCPENLAYDADKKFCVTSCGDRPKYRLGGETLCQNSCPKEVRYRFKD